MPTVSEIRARMDAALPGIAQRAARFVLDELAERVVALGAGTDLVNGLALTLVALGKERTQALRRIDGDTQVLRAATASGTGRFALEDALARMSEPWQAAADRRALDRHLDQTAIEDRLVRRRHAVDQRWELMATVVAAQPVDGVPPPRRDELRRAALEIADERTTRWPVRVAALRLMGTLSASAHLADDRTHEVRLALRRIARDGRDDPWVQSEALSAWLAFAPDEEAEGVLAWILARGPEADGTAHRDHVFARARAAHLAARHDQLDLLVATVEGDEPSEHVRMACLRALALSDRPDDKALVAGRLVGPPDRWRVAAAGALALLDANAGQDEEAWALVGRYLPLAPARAVRVVLDGAWARVRAGTLDVAHAERVGTSWRDALARWSAHDVDDPDLRRLAVVLATWARLQAEPATRAAWPVLAEHVRTHAEGSSTRFASGPVAALRGDQILDVLFLLAHEDVDLSAEPLGTGGPVRLDAVPRGGWRVYVGGDIRRAAWRVQHELTHPRHDKRQAWRHTTDEIPSGRLVAMSGRMTEVVATEVPGRRVSSPTTLAWQEHLPLPATLLTALRHGEAVVRHPEGTITLRPTGWSSRWRGARAYVGLAELRGRLAALPPDEASRVYDKALGEAGFRVQRDPTQTPSAPVAHAAAVAPVAVGMGLLQDVQQWGWLGTAGSSDLHTYGELAALSAGALTFWTAGKVVREAQVRRWRRKIPLVVGGWGSRGKSSVERLKAALFHGLGYSVLCKSTGCEAMLLLALPGLDPVEVFLYRPRDKATIVEQQAVLGIAAQWRPQVVLWECMALNPIYTGILQGEWMRDDLTTITNTYPDHEDIQGPSGRDVADTISTFTPHRGHLVTSEHHMTPVLERRARARHSGFAACRPEDWDLVPRDLLKRFPYQAYDRNVSLLCRLGEHLGVPRDVTLRTIADHVLIDLGAFKRYGPMDVDGRTLAFVNGCSANDRASFLSNWERADLDTFDDTAGLSRGLITILNNRGDRLARQAMFERIAALDVSAERVVIIGTNVGPMYDGILEALRRDLVPALLEIAHGPDGRRKLFDMLCKRLRRRPMTPAEADAAVARAAAERELPAGVPSPDDRWTQAETWWREEVAWLTGLRDQGEAWSMEAAIDALVGFLARRVVPFRDSTMKGDAILRDLAAMMPEGTRTELLGTENIKGTGLDFVYRWTSIERVLGWLAVLPEGSAVDVRDRLERLTAYDGYGLYDARHALGVVRALHAQGRFSRLACDEDAEAALATLDRAVQRRTAKLAGADDSGGESAFSRFRKQVDVWGSMRRRAAADRLYRDLSHGRVGMERAAVEAKKLVDGEKA
ncbi:MAG: hypothetical protein H6733_10395 [Alphaproteobacteria bacterium]|nr:hypothetical protein [Alphaproteobacteria bacterium]